MQLLERDGALAALAGARSAAARGDGRVVVTGEPGIGKTSLVTRSGRSTTWRAGSPRPLADALATGAAPPEIQLDRFVELEVAGLELGSSRLSG